MWKNTSKNNFLNANFKKIVISFFFVKYKGIWKNPGYNCCKKEDYLNKPVQKSVPAC